MSKSFVDAHVFGTGDFHKAILWTVSDRGWMKLDIELSRDADFTVSAIDMAMITAEALLKPYLIFEDNGSDTYPARVYVHPTNFSYRPHRGSDSHEPIR